MKTKKQILNEKKREELENELSILIDAIIQIEAGLKVTDRSYAALEALVSRRKHEIEKELLSLPPNTADDL